VLADFDICNCDWKEKSEADYSIFQACDKFRKRGCEVEIEASIFHRNPFD